MSKTYDFSKFAKDSDPELKIERTNDHPDVPYTLFEKTGNGWYPIGDYVSYTEAAKARAAIIVQWRNKKPKQEPY